MGRFFRNSIVQTLLACVVIVAVAYVGIKALQASHAAPTLPQSSTAPYRVLKVFSAANESSNITAAEQQAEAEHFSAITVGGNGQGYSLSQMKTWAGDSNSTNNGQLTMLQYINASHVGGCAAAVQADGGTTVAHNAQGSVMAHGGNYVEDIGNTTWQKDRAAAATNADKTYDGVWFDVLGPEVVNNNTSTTSPSLGGYNDTVTQVANGKCGGNGSGPGVPLVTGSTSTYYTTDTWAKAGGQLLQTVKAGTPSSKLIAFNGSRSGNEPLWGPATIGMHENWLDISNANNYPAPTTWKNDLNELTTVANAGNHLEAYVKPCFGNYSASCVGCTTSMQSGLCQGVPDNHTDAMNKAHEFALATFLLGTNGDQYFNFRYSDNGDTWEPYWSNLLIGSIPTADPTYHQVGAVYYRAFTNGVVVVNPDTQVQSASIPALSGTYNELAGGTKSFSGTVSSMPAHSALILLSSASTTGPSVSISAPTNGATVSGTSVAITASATGSSITGMQIDVDGNAIANCTTASCSASWDSTAVANGTHDITVTATGAGGTSSASIQITVNNIPAPPLCSGNPTAPVITANPTATDSTVTLSWSASTPATGCTMEGYQVYRNGASAAQTTQTTYQDSGLAANTSYTYTVVGLDTNGHASSASAPVTVTTKASTTGKVTVVITSLKNGQLVSGDVTIDALVTGLHPGHVGFFIDSKALVYTSVDSADIKWATTSADNGTHQITVNVYDSSNNLLASASVKVYVWNTYCLPRSVTFGQGVCF